MLLSLIILFFFVLAKRLRNRSLDLGDVSPSNLEHFSTALRTDVQGIQVDFDDGHCPTWKNQIIGLYNVHQAIRGQLPDLPHISKGPILMFRPRAWNMIEHNMSIKGKETPGALFDFALLVFHNARILSQYEVGPCFYLSKLENKDEATLWNNIFSWTEQVLKIPHGTIKACVLIEDILSVFEMELILYELRDHSLGLNCGIWDYTASIIRRFGDNKAYLVPDREKYVKTSKSFLRDYIKLAIWVCHKRGTQLTGGMVANILPPNANYETSSTIADKVCRSKLKEIETGLDGFLVYDIALVSSLNKMWKEYRESHPQVSMSYALCTKPDTTLQDLLTFPVGGITMRGLKHNISVTILFIYNWLNGKGHFIYEGLVEDSATAEISRSQIWQWIRHEPQLEDKIGISVTRRLILKHASCIVAKFVRSAKDAITREKMHAAYLMFLRLINHECFPDFITSYINDQYIFRYMYAPNYNELCTKL